MPPRPLRVAVAVMEGGPSLVPIGIAELLEKSSELARAHGDHAPRIDVRLVGASRHVRVSGNRPMHVDATYASVRECDVAIVSAVDGSETVALTQNRAAASWAARMFARGADVASVCTGAFVLAEAGLLSGRRATTHWAFQDVLRARFRDVRVEPQAVVVDTGRVCTAGGATSFINLTLHWVERLLGAEVASLASKMYLIDVNKAPQGAYAIFSTQKDHGDEAILRAQAAIERSPDLSVGEIAKTLGMSPRTFERRFKAATGNTPRAYVQRARVEVAKRALERSKRTVSEIAEGAGYADVVAFRRIFQRETGLTPASYRERYGPRAEASTIAPARAKRRVAERARDRGRAAMRRR